MPTNPNPLGPSPSFPERQGIVIDAKVAVPKRNAIGHRSGDRYAEEGTGWIPSISSAFVGGVSSADSGASHRDVEVQIAGQANGRTRLAGQNPPPTWGSAEKQDLAAFAGAHAVAFGEIDNNRRPYTGTGRTGNPHTITPLHGLDRGERNRAVYGKKFAPKNGGRGRVNVADITEADL